MPLPLVKDLISQSMQLVEAAHAFEIAATNRNYTRCASLLTRIVEVATISCIFIESIDHGTAVETLKKIRELCNKAYDERDGDYVGPSPTSEGGSIAREPTI